MTDTRPDGDIRHGGYGHVCSETCEVLTRPDPVTTPGQRAKHEASLTLIGCSDMIGKDFEGACRSCIEAALESILREKDEEIARLTALHRKHYGSACCDELDEPTSQPKEQTGE